MADKLVTETSKRKYIRQPPSVPFLWEERPGVAKKDWKPQFSSIVLAPPPQPTPIKLIASVPFNWEEKPGIPLSSFSQPSMESTLPTSPAKLVTSQLNLLDFECYRYTKGDNYGASQGKVGDAKERIFDFDLESFSFKTDDSSSSSPSLLANCLVSCAALSTAVPVQDMSSADDFNDQFESPPTPASDTDSSTSSYATGVSSLAGSSFLKRLFPLYSTNSSFLRKVECSSEDRSTLAEQNQNSSMVVRRPPTLGELIMMSRRRSCQHKAAQMREQNLSMGLISRKAFRCFMFQTSIKMFKQMQKQYQPRLKLI